MNYRDRDRVFAVDRWTRYLWRRSFDEQPELREWLDANGDRWLGLEAMARETFARLFNGRTVEVDAQRPEDGWQRTVHGLLDELPSWQELRRVCRGDRWESAKTTLDLLRGFLDLLPAPQAAEDPEPLREQAMGLQRLLQGFDHPANGSAEQELAAALAAVRRTGQQLVASHQQSEQDIDLSALRTGLRQACRGALDDSMERSREVQALGCWSPSGALAVSVQLKAELAGRLAKSEKLRLLAREAGRFKRMALEKQASRVEHGADELHDVGLGREVARLLPLELAKLADPELETWFDLGWSEGQLLEYQLEGKDTLGEGPMVVLLDQSSSMEGPPEIWSKALALGLLQVATVQRRSCRVVHFNSGVVRQDDFGPGEVEPGRLVEAMATFDGGGTDFGPPLNAAIDAIDTSPPLAKADVVLVTDGESDVSDALEERWSRLRTAREVSAYGVFLGSGSMPSSLTRLTDKQYLLDDFDTDERIAGELLSLTRWRAS